MTVVPNRPTAVLMVLFVAAFTMDCAEMLVLGMLDLISVGLDVSVPAAGALVTASAAGCAVGGPVLALLTTRLDRRRVLLGSAAVFAAGDLDEMGNEDLRRGGQARVASADDAERRPRQRGPERHDTDDPSGGFGSRAGHDGDPQAGADELAYAPEVRCLELHLRMQPGRSTCHVDDVAHRVPGAEPDQDLVPEVLQGHPAAGCESVAGRCDDHELLGRQWPSLVATR